jgi:hypothetical protein
MVRLLNENVLDAPSTASQDLVHRGAGVGGQVKAIGHLNSTGRALLATFGVRTGSIAHDDLDARVSAQPIGEDLRIAIIEQIDGFMRLEVHQQGSVSPLFAPQSNVVHAQNAWATSNIGVSDRVQDPQECVRANRHTGLARETSASFSSGVQCERGEQFGCVVSPTRVPCQHTVEALGEDPAGAGRGVAEPAPAMDAHPHYLAAPGQIKRMTLVPAMLPPTQLATSRTRNSDSRGLDDQD